MIVRAEVVGILIREIEEINQLPYDSPEILGRLDKLQEMVEEKRNVFVPQMLKLVRILPSSPSFAWRKVELKTPSVRTSLIAFTMGRRIGSLAPIRRSASSSQVTCPGFPFLPLVMIGGWARSS